MSKDTGTAGQDVNLGWIVNNAPPETPAIERARAQVRQEFRTIEGAISRIKAAAAHLRRQPCEPVAEVEGTKYTLEAWLADEISQSAVELRQIVRQEKFIVRGSPWSRLAPVCRHDLRIARARARERQLIGVIEQRERTGRDVTGERRRLRALLGFTGREGRPMRPFEIHSLGALGMSVKAVCDAAGVDLCRNAHGELHPIVRL